MARILRNGLASLARHRAIASLAALAVLVAACEGGDPAAVPATGPFVDVLVLSGDSSAVTIPYLAALGPRGDLVVSAQELTRLPLVVDRAQHQIRTLGSIGEGPGEFLMAGAILFKTDSVLVSDYARGAISVFDARGVFSRTIPAQLALGTEVILMRGDTLVSARPLRSLNSFGRPFHRIGADGQVDLSFGTEDRTVEPGVDWPLLRRIVADTDSTFWSADQTRYRLERWSLSGNRLAVLDIARDWFPELLPPFPALGSGPYPPHISDLGIDEHGHLIVLIRRGRPVASTAGQQAAEHRQALSFSDEIRELEQLVEVIEPTSGMLVASAGDSSTAIAGILEGGALFGVRADRDGNEHPVVMKFPHPSTGGS